MTQEPSHDVVILGAGLAGLSLARQLLLETDKRILLVERRPELPAGRQKVGESLVQVGGFYFSKVLDLEEHLLREHYMKYNLRFYWKSGGRDNRSFEELSQLYIRPFSNIACYQLDRNRFEAELLRRNLQSPRCTICTGAGRLEVDLNAGGPHTVRFRAGDRTRVVTADWLVDTTGRARYLARRQGMARSSSIRHGSFFWWVEGLVNVEKLTDSSPRQIRQHPNRRHLGHLPIWLATNHFMGEGFWFWVIPLQGKTSLGLVYDHASIPHGDVFSVEKATEWVCREFPLFARDLPRRRVLDFGGFRSYSHDCRQTIDASRWALAGESGRFTDPLYSPGSDLIALHNTLIVDAIGTENDTELANKCRLYEQLMRALYAAYVPAYATSYDALGDQETFSLKYAWELTIYYAAYVFPFINELFTDRRFMIAFLRFFSRLGPINQDIQTFLSDYFQWRKRTAAAGSGPVFFDLSEIKTLREAERTFYRVGVGTAEAKRVLGRQLEGIEELARFIVAHVSAAVLEDRRVLLNRRFIDGIELSGIRFDPSVMAARYAECRHERETYSWSFDPYVLDRLRGPAPITESARSVAQVAAS